MIDHADAKEGEHFWALMGWPGQPGKLVVVNRTKEGYEVCGGWECVIPHAELQLIARIDRPEGHEETELYYK